MIDRQDADMKELSSLPTASGKDMNIDSNNNDNHHTDPQRRSSRVAEKYGLRPRTIIRRLQLERTREDLPRRETKSSKNRPPPLSKYRRKTANARERHRMREINNAFETLRQILPDFCSRRAASAMTKITTLKLAVNYIRALSHILEDGHPGDISFFDGLNFDEIAMCSPEPPPTPGSTHTATTTTTITTTTHFLPHSSYPHQVLTATSPLTSSATSTIGRTSLGSNSDLSDLLSDDSCVFDDNLDAFDDITELPEVDALSLLMAPDGNTLTPNS